MDITHLEQLMNQVGNHPVPPICDVNTSQADKCSGSLAAKTCTCASGFQIRTPPESKRKLGSNLEWVIIFMHSRARLRGESCALLPYCGPEFGNSVSAPPG